MKYYVEISTDKYNDGPNPAVYKTDGKCWWSLGIWCNPHDVWFTKCKKPKTELVEIAEVKTLNKDFK